MSMFGGSETLANYKVEVGAEISDLERGMRRAADVSNGAVAEIQARTSGIGSALAGLGSGIMAAFSMAGAAAGVAIGALGALTAAVEGEEKANRRLGRSVGELGAEMQGVFGSFDEFASKLSDVTSRSESAIKKMAAIGASAGGLSGDQLKQAVAAAEGLAAKYEHLGVSGEEAMRLIARAARGDFAGLERLGIQIDENAEGQAKYNQVIRDGLSGLTDAEEAANQTAGGLRKLWNAGNELLGTVGRLLGLGDNAGAMFATIAGWVDRLTAGLAELKPFVDQTKESMLGLLGLSGGQTGFATIIAGLENVVDAAVTSLKVFAIGAEVAFFELFNEVLSAIPKDLATAVIEAWGMIVAVIQNTWNGLTSFIAEGIAYLMQLVDNVFGTDLLGGVKAGDVGAKLRQDAEQFNRDNFAEKGREAQERIDRLRSGEGAFDTDGLIDAIDQLKKELGERTTKRIEDALKGMEDAARSQGDGAKELEKALVNVNTAGLGISEDEGKAFNAQQIQTVLGEVAIPGGDRVRVVQEAQLAEQREIRKGITKLASGGSKVIFVG